MPKTDVMKTSRGFEAETAQLLQVGLAHCGTRKAVRLWLTTSFPSGWGPSELFAWSFKDASVVREE